MAPRHLTAPFCGLLLAFSLAACNSRYEHDNSKNSGVMDTLSKAYDDTRRTITGYTPSTEQVTAQAQKQFNDMFSFEYKVVEFDNAAPVEKIQQMLSELGAERWECFNILDRGNSFLIPCRRRPISLLRYALKFLPIP